LFQNKTFFVFNPEGLPVEFWRRSNALFWSSHYFMISWPQENICSPLHTRWHHLFHKRFVERYGSNTFSLFSLNSSVIMRLHYQMTLPKYYMCLYHSGKEIPANCSDNLD